MDHSHLTFIGEVLCIDPACFDDGIITAMLVGFGVVTVLSIIGIWKT